MKDDYLPRQNQTVSAREFTRAATFFFRVVAFENAATAQAFWLLIVPLLLLAFGSCAAALGVYCLIFWLLVAVALAFWLWRKIRDIAIRLRDPEHQCLSCGYALTNLPISTRRMVVCPECGTRCKIVNANPTKK